jgi:hypothetical protein
MATLRVMMRGAKVNAISRPHGLQNYFLIFEITTEGLPERLSGKESWSDFG